MTALTIRIRTDEGGTRTCVDRHDRDRHQRQRAQARATRRCEDRKHTPPPIHRPYSSR